MVSSIEAMAEQRLGIVVPLQFDRDNERDFHAVEQCSDVQNAHRFWELAGDNMMFVAGIGWLKWDGVRWQPDPHEAMRIGQRIGSVVAREAQARLDDYLDEPDKSSRETIQRDIDKLNRHIKHSESRSAIESAIKLAECSDPVLAESLDTHPMKFNCANGTVNLSTGKLETPNRQDLLTKSGTIEYDPDARCPEWEKTLLEIFEGKTHIIKFVQRAFGYCMTGHITDQVLIVFFGEGANGKDVLLGRFRKVMGDYGGDVAPGLLIETRNEQHPTAVYDLRGKRLGISSETGEGKPLNETLIKQITGSEMMKARGMRQDYIQFKNEVLIFLMTNHLPEIRGDDYAIWRRIRLVPFNRIFKEDERDERLGQRLDETELPGILNWCIEGCLEWQRIGLAPPNEVTSATAGYRSDQDVLRQFFECECDFGQVRQVTSQALWTRWKGWCVENDQKPHSQKWLAPRLKRRNCSARRTRSGVIWEGISLKPMENGERCEP